MNFKPMLSASLDGVDLSTLHYPLVVSPKLDGVRCIVWEGVAYSRNAKPIRNRFVQEWARKYHNIDGELIVGSPIEGLVLNRTQSGVMAFDGEPDFTFHLFDCIESDDRRFVNRRNLVAYEHRGEPSITVVPHLTAINMAELLSFESQWLDQGYEGLMARDPNGPYKHGRSTLREGYLMKLKRFVDGEGVVVRLEEGNHNTNELQRDELGRAKRSHNSSGLVGNGMVGQIWVRLASGEEMKLAPGTMSHAERVHFWQNPNLIIGKTAHWRAFGYGQKDTPRFPRFYGIREDA